MTHSFRNRKWLAVVALSTGVGLTACVDKTYDLDDVDFTIGVGTEQLVLPNNNSTMEIQLNDFLDLNNSDFVFIASKDNRFGLTEGDYYVFKEGDDIKPARPHVDEFTVEGINPTSIDMRIDLSGIIHAPAKGQHAPAVSYTIDKSWEQDVVKFNGSSDRGTEKRVPKEVMELTRVDISETLTLSVDFTHLNGVINNIQEVFIQLPAYFNMTDAERRGGTVEQVVTDKATNTIRMVNVKTADIVTLTFGVTGLEVENSASLPATDAYAAYVPGGEGLNGTVAIKGNVFMRMTVNETVEIDPLEIASRDFSDFHVSVGLAMSDISVISATGRFNPTIDLTDMGSININDVPDFLSDGKVCIDLYNPEIHLFIDNNTDVDGTVTATLTAEYNDGTAPVVISVPQVAVSRNKLNQLCICRSAQGIDAKYTPVVVPNLTDLIKKIPDRITFTADAEAKHGADVPPSTFRLGDSNYAIVPAYEFITPLAFGEEAVISYNDTIDDINGDLDDVQLTRSTTLTVTANVKTRLPLFVDFSAYGIDVNGNRISDDDLNFSVNCSVDASDGTVVKDGTVEVVVSQKKEDALKRLDGIVFEANAAAAKRDGNGNIVDKMVGVGLNAYNQTLQLTDVQVVLKGYVVYDANDSDD